MAEPVSDAEVTAWMAQNTPLPPWARSREAARNYLEQEKTAREAVETRRAAAAPQQTNELAMLRAEVVGLRQRVRALEKMVALRGPLTAAIGNALAEIGKGLEEKIDAVRDQALKFGDIFTPGRAYQPSTLVVSKGSLWISLATTADPPGSSASWQLVTKAGTIVDQARRT
jgi:hypothetical protein